MWRSARPRRSVIGRLLGRRPGSVGVRRRGRPSTALGREIRPDREERARPLLRGVGDDASKRGRERRQRGRDPLAPRALRGDRDSSAGRRRGRPAAAGRRRRTIRRAGLDREQRRPDRERRGRAEERRPRSRRRPMSRSPTMPDVAAGRRAAAAARGGPPAARRSGRRASRASARTRPGAAGRRRSPSGRRTSAGRGGRGTARAARSGRGGPTRRSPARRRSRLDGLGRLDDDPLVEDRRAQARDAEDLEVVAGVVAEGEPDEPLERARVTGGARGPGRARGPRRSRCARRPGRSSAGACAARAGATRYQSAAGDVGERDGDAFGQVAGDPRSRRGSARRGLAGRAVPARLRARRPRARPRSRRCQLLLGGGSRTHVACAGRRPGAAATSVVPTRRASGPRAPRARPPPRRVGGHIGLKLYHCSGAAASVAWSASATCCVARATSASERRRHGDHRGEPGVEHPVGAAPPDGDRQDHRAGLGGERRGSGRKRGPGPEEADRDAVGSIAPVDQEREHLRPRAPRRSRGGCATGSRGRPTPRAAGGSDRTSRGTSNRRRRR